MSDAVMSTLTVHCQWEDETVRERTGQPHHVPMLSKCSTSTSYPWFCWAWWLVGRFVAFHPKGRGFESRSSRHVGTLGKSFTHSCLWRFGVKLRHSYSRLSVLCRSGLQEALYK